MEFLLALVTQGLYAAHTLLIVLNISAAFDMLRSALHG